MKAASKKRKKSRFFGFSKNVKNVFSNYGLIAIYGECNGIKITVDRWPVYVLVDVAKNTAKPDFYVLFIQSSLDIDTWNNYQLVSKKIHNLSTQRIQNRLSPRVK